MRFNSRLGRASRVAVVSPCAALRWIRYGMYECVHPYQALAYPLDLRMLHRISANHAAKALEVLHFDA